MKPQFFGLWVILLTAGVMHSYSVFRLHFSGLEDAKAKVKSLTASVEREKLKTQIALFEAESFRQSVATLLKNSSPELQNYNARNIASLSQVSSSQRLAIEPASSLFHSARKLFNEKKYEDSNRLLTELIKRYSFSVHIIESYFLLTEGLYQVHDTERCLEVVDDMVGLFPENELTGFALLRVASILRERERIEDAGEIYRTIVDSFKNKDLVSQAQKSLAELEL